LQVKQRSIGVVILLGLISLIVFFYTFSVNSASLYILLLAYILAGVLDVLILALHLVRPYPDTNKRSFDPSKLTILIACYNGADVLPATIKDATRHVPASQILVISDKSTDNTVAIARSMGVQVYENQRNMNKSMSINQHIHRVTTPYTLILDDDTLIGKTFMPTSLLDDGYSAVAFEVMPIPTGTLINKFQQFEYQKTMTIRKQLRASTGSVGNVSGAIGMYHTKDLQAQARRHSGQPGGEDQQRTLLTHLESKGKGVTYCDSAVETLAPDTFASLFKQRAFKWNTSSHENFVLLVRAILHPRTHHLLKIEKAYSLFILLTEPFRIVAFTVLVLAPLGSFVSHLGLIWLFYVGLEVASWVKTGRQTPLWIVMIFPFYAKMCGVARSIAHFYWFKKKYIYAVKNQFHQLIHGRNLLKEYAATSFVLLTLWGLAGLKLAALFNPSRDAQIRYRLPEWQPLEGLSLHMSLAHILIVSIAAWYITKILRRIVRRKPKSVMSAQQVEL
jgi:cellulose synthase/poly-beta-1,6-N-acetylglucosamine synthase-like glycosyltransferase